MLFAALFTAVSVFIVFLYFVYRRKAIDEGIKNLSSGVTYSDVSSVKDGIKCVVKLGNGFSVNLVANLRWVWFRDDELSLL